MPVRKSVPTTVQLTAPIRTGPTIKARVVVDPTANIERPFVKPCDKDPKTGCMFCSLAPWHADFDSFSHLFQRKADAILKREKEPHTVRSRGVAEEWTEVDVLFIGGAPGFDDDAKGTPFVGRNGGTMLRNAMAELLKGTAVADARLGFTGVVRCRPPRNRDPNQTEIRSCLPELIREIKARKPRLIVATSNAALDVLCGQTGITMLAGKFLKTTNPQLPEMDVMGCLHPGFVLRMDHEMDKFLLDLLQVVSFLDGSYQALPGIGEYTVLETLAETRQLFADFRAAGTKVAFDTETGSLSPFQSVFPKLLCFSFCNTAGRAYVLPFDHADSPWCVGGPLEHERADIIAILVDFFTSDDFIRIAQNEKFDRKHIQQAIGVEPGITHGDTMCKHLTIDERRGTHGLKVLAFSATGMGGYERALDNYIDKHPACDPDKDGSFANIPGAVLFPYAGMDADCTIRVDDWLEAHPEYTANPRFHALATEFFPKLSVALARMEYAGAKVNPDVVARLDVIYRDEMTAATAKVLQFPEVLKYEREVLHPKKGPDERFNPGSTMQLRSVLFDGCGIRPSELTEKGFDTCIARHKRYNTTARDKFTTDVAARKTLLAAGMDGGPAVPLPREIPFTSVVEEAIKTKEWDLFTTDAESLHEFERQGNALSAAILEYRGSQVMHSTFVVPLQTMLDSEDKIHGNFNIIGTVTGRLSSNDPNLQNIPNKGGGLIKQAYGTRFGSSGLLLNVDFSQIELRIAAAWFKEPKMRQVYLDKQDLHLLTASIIAGMTMEQFKKLPKDEQKIWRTRAKRVNFGSLYGGGPPALQSTLKKDGVYASIEECKAFLEAFFAGYPRLREGMDELEAFVRKNGYLESFTGRRRRIPEVFSVDRELQARALRQSVNFPIQSGAGDMTLMSLVIIDDIMRREKMASKPILTVHDSIVFDCHVDEVFDVSKLAKEVMENIPSLSDYVLPGLDWKWLDVPIIAECETGPNWGQMVEFEPDDLLGLSGVTFGSDKPVIGLNEKGKEDILRKPANIDEMWQCFNLKSKKAA